MNIYEFVNSRDIREHWQNIGFVPNSVESAWIVWQSKNHTIAEKHAAWQWIIDNMPDCEVRGKWIDTPQDSLHEFLKRFMEIERGMIEELFKADERAVYTYRAIWKGDDEWDKKRDTLFATFDDAYADATDDEEIPPVFLEFEKRHIGAFGKNIRVCMTPEKEPVFLDEEFYFENSEDSALYYHVFYYMYFALPLPFEKGDIIYRANPKFMGPYEQLSDFFNSNFVFESIHTNFDSEGNCSSYMTAQGYHTGGGNIYHGSTGILYIDFEKYTGNSEGDIRLLIPVSKYLKGEIELDVLLRANSYIREELSFDDYSRGLLKHEKKLVGLWE